jgi:hypothetical protein
MVQMCEMQNVTIALLAKQLAEKDEILKKRKKASIGKRVRLKDIAVYSTADILRIAREAEAALAARRGAKRQRVRKTPKIDDREEDEDLDYSFKLIVDDLAMRRRGAVFSHVEV